MRFASALALTLLLPAGCGDDTSSDGTTTGMDSGADAGPTSAPPTTNPATTPGSGPGDGPSMGDSTTMSVTPDPTTSTSTSASTTTEAADGSSDSSTGETPGSESSTGSVSDQLPPTNGAAILPWLEGGEYLGWAAESGVHPSSGPHGPVRSFFNDVLLESLEAGNPMHPRDAASVKELYQGGELIGWAVEVKTQADSDGGEGWYWYEIINGAVVADGNGVGLCFGCHSDGGTDFVLSPFPLQ